MLPAAILAAVLANFLLIFWEMSSLMVPVSPRWVQFMSSIAGGYAFVFVGAFVAPTRKDIVSIALASLFAAYLVALGVLATTKQVLGSDPLWWVIVCLVAGTVGAVSAAIHVFSGNSKV